MQRIDRIVGSTLAVLALAVLWTAQGFPKVPGQKVGAGFLPMIVGIGLLVCALLLVRRSFDAARYGAAATVAAAPENWRLALAVVGAVLLYILLADKLGFLLVAPLMLLAVLRAFAQGWRPSLAWAIGGTLLVHLAFYKLLRVPLPWGLVRPFY
ncbi:MAG: tripartite tricarboxylate transporter TctB family protein [Aquabacterium sp.]